MCYYGHVENTSNLGGDVAWSFFFGALVEIPAYSVPFLINREGGDHSDPTLLSGPYGFGPKIGLFYKLSW